MSLMATDFADNGHSIALGNRYEAIRVASRSALLANDISVDPLPRPGDPRWGISLVLRPQLGESVWSALGDLAMCAGADHSYYSSQNVHVTIRTLESYRAEPSGCDPVLEEYAAAAKAATARIGEFRISYRGFAASKTSLILCGFPHFDLVAVREALHRQLERTDGVRASPEPTIERLRTTCHASLAVFSKQLSDPAGFIAAIDRFQGLEFGSSVNCQLQIVSFARTPTTINIHELVSI